MAESEDKLPLVSIIIPSFNHELYVEQAIRSVIHQTHPAVELIVIDDCSVDRTAQIADRLAREHGFRFVRNETNLGLNASLEKALATAHGEFVCIVSSDDWIKPDKIAEQVELLGRNGWDAVYGTGWVVEEGRSTLIDLGDLEQPFADGTVLERLYTDSSHAPLLQSALIKRECFSELAPERRRFKSDDWVMLIRLVERYRVGFVNRPWFYYRQHAANAHRDYWGTLPQRIEVVAEVTPDHLRPRALANIFRDQAQFLYMDGKRGMAAKFLLASMVLNPSARWGKQLTDILGRAGRRAIRKLSAGIERSS